MAEPVSPLPVSPPQPTTSPTRSEPIPLRQVTRPVTPYRMRASRTTGQALQRSISVIQTSWENLERSATRLARRAQIRVRRMKDKHPLEIIAGVAAAAFLLGVGLRIGRSHHE